MKKEARCKQCGRTFVKYAYEKIARCEECRKLNRAWKTEQSTQLTKVSEADR